MKTPPHLKTAYTQGRTQQLKQLLTWWPERFKQKRVFDIGCARGEMTWLIAQVATQVYCWDIASRFEHNIQQLKSSNILWCRPHHVPSVDTVYAAGVLQNVMIRQDCVTWIDSWASFIDVDWWIFREVLHAFPSNAKPNSAYYGDQWPASHYESGWGGTEQVINQCKTLEVIDQYTVALPDHHSAASPQRFLLCKKL